MFKEEHRKRDKVSSIEKVYRAGNSSVPTVKNANLSVQLIKQIKFICLISR